MFYLEVEVSSEPVVECRFSHVAGGVQLEGHPGLGSVMVNLHGDMVEKIIVLK